MIDIDHLFQGRRKKHDLSLGIILKFDVGFYGSL